MMAVMVIMMMMMGPSHPQFGGEGAEDRNTERDSRKVTKGETRGSMGGAC